MYYDADHDAYVERGGLVPVPRRLPGGINQAMFIYFYLGRPNRTSFCTMPPRFSRLWVSDKRSDFPVEAASTLW